MTMVRLLVLAALPLAACGGGAGGAADAGAAFTYVGFTPVGGFGTSKTAASAADLQLFPSDLRTGADGKLYLASEGAVWKIDPVTLAAQVVLGAPGARAGTHLPATGNVRSFDFDPAGRMYLGIDDGTTSIIGRLDVDQSYSELSREAHQDARDAISRVRVSPKGDVFWTNPLKFVALNPSAPVDPYNLPTILDCQHPASASDVPQTYCVRNLEIDPQGNATVQSGRKNPLAGVDGQGNLLYWNVGNTLTGAISISASTATRDGTGGKLFDIGSLGAQPNPPAAHTTRDEIDTDMTHPGLVAEAARTPDGSYWTYTIDSPDAASLAWRGHGLYVHRK